MLKIILILLVFGLNCGAATNRLVIKRLIMPTFSKAKSTGDPCLDMSTSFAATKEHNVFLQAINVGPWNSNTETNQANWPRPGEVRYAVGEGGMTAYACVIDSQRWLYLWAIMEYVPGYDIPPAPPIAARGKTVLAVPSRKTIRTKAGSFPATPPLPPAPRTVTPEKGATLLLGK